MLGSSHSPNLVLTSLGLELELRLAIAQPIGEEARIGQDVAIVIFCVPTIPEGAEMEAN